MTTKPIIRKRDGGYYCTSFDQAGLCYEAFAVTMTHAYYKWTVIMSFCHQQIGMYLKTSPKN